MILIIFLCGLFLFAMGVVAGITWVADKLSSAMDSGYLLLKTDQGNWEGEKSAFESIRLWLAMK
jgi:hypothetical protein